MFFNDRNRLGFDDVPPEAAESLARSWGYSDLDESWGAMQGWANGLLHEETDDDE